MSRSDSVGVSPDDFALDVLIPSVTFARTVREADPGDGVDTDLDKTKGTD